MKTMNENNEQKQRSCSKATNKRLRPVAGRAESEIDVTGGKAVGGDAAPLVVRSVDSHRTNR